MHEKHKNDPRNDAEYWNDTYPTGQPIELIEDDGNLTYTQTRSRAWMSGAGDAIIKVDGKSGGYLLSRIKAR